MHLYKEKTAYGRDVLHASLAKTVRIANFITIVFIS